MSEEKLQKIKGGICGIIVSCFINLFIVLSFYGIPFELITIGIAAISIILPIVFLIGDRISEFVYSFFSSIALLLITYLIIDFTGIVRMFFKIVYGASEEMWAGDGFGMVVILIFSISGFLLGSIIALIFTIIKIRKNRRNLSRV